MAWVVVASLLLAKSPLTYWCCCYGYSSFGGSYAVRRQEFRNVAHKHVGSAIWWFRMEFIHIDCPQQRRWKSNYPVSVYLTSLIRHIKVGPVYRVVCSAMVRFDYYCTTLLYLAWVDWCRRRAMAAGRTVSDGGDDEVVYLVCTFSTGTWCTYYQDDSK